MDALIPETRYTSTDGVSVAYQVLGSGPLDLVIIPGWISNLEVYWEQQDWAGWTRRLASFARVILFDKRGTGLSDRVTDMPTLEVRMDDLRAVMDAAGSKRAAFFGWSEGGPMAALFAATYPERAIALVLQGSYATQMRANDYPWGTSIEEAENRLAVLSTNWGTKEFANAAMATRMPSKIGDADFARWWGRFMRLSVGVRGAIDLARMNASIDVRNVLSALFVPTLVLQSIGDQTVPVAQSKDLANRISGAKYVEYESLDHVPWLSGSNRLADEIEEFLTGVRSPPAVDRVLTTVLFTDIVAATEKLVAMGDQRWRMLLQRHNEIIRRELSRFRGFEMDTAGDGFFATFDGPARAIKCACVISDAVKTLGIELRAGLHTGECEIVDGKFCGIAVHVGARIMSRAEANEVLVSSTVKALVAGSGIAFADRGTHRLKGINEDWRIYAAASDIRTV